MFLCGSEEGRKTMKKEKEVGVRLQAELGLDVRLETGVVGSHGWGALKSGGGVRYVHLRGC